MRRFAAAWGLVIAALASAGCKPKGDADVDAAMAPADAAPLADLDGSLDAGSDAATKPMTQEEALAHAAEQVAAALGEARGKKPDCDKIVDLLDVSFAMAPPKMSDDDKPAFVALVTCAKRKDRWRLMRDVATVMSEGDATFKSAWYLPRALVGLGQYEAAAQRSAAILRQAPKDGEVYTTAALASARLELWDAVAKAADRALAVQKEKKLLDDVTAQAHVWKAEALLHQGKIDESSKELDVAKKIKPYEFAIKMREKNDAVKATNLEVDVDASDEIFLGLYPLYAKNAGALGPVVTLKLSTFGDKPLPVRVEVTLPGVAEPIGKTVTLVKGRREVVKLTPPMKPEYKVDALKTSQASQLSYKITQADSGAVLYEETRKITLEPKDRLPSSIRAHETDLRSARELEAAWITPASKTVAGFLDAAKKRAPGAELAGGGGATLPQVAALCEELRARGVTFARDPSFDSEANRVRKTRLPAEVLGAQKGDALEGVLVFAALMEAVGLDVVIVHVPGHAIAGWLASRADRALPDAMKSAVQTPLGSAFFVETTLIGSGPADAAIAQGAAEVVEHITKKTFARGSGTFTLLSRERKLGILPQAGE